MGNNFSWAKRCKWIDKGRWKKIWSQNVKILLNFLDHSQARKKHRAEYFASLETPAKLHCINYWRKMRNGVGVENSKRQSTYLRRILEFKLLLVYCYIAYNWNLCVALQVTKYRRTCHNHVQWFQEVLFICTTYLDKV